MCAIVRGEKNIKAFRDNIVKNCILQFNSKRFTNIQKYRNGNSGIAGINKGLLSSILNEVVTEMTEETGDAIATQRITDNFTFFFLLCIVLLFLRQQE